jgi:hypothetical protein
MSFFEDTDTETDPDAAEIRQTWRQLVDVRLPEQAKQRPDWPVYRDHCFARILLDNAVGVMWRTVIPAPAWRNTPLPVLQTAIDLGEAILSDDADIWALNDVSLKMRGKAPKGKVAAIRRRRMGRSRADVAVER